MRLLGPPASHKGAAAAAAGVVNVMDCKVQRNPSFVSTVAQQEYRGEMGQRCGRQVV